MSEDKDAGKRKQDLREIAQALPFQPVWTIKAKDGLDLELNLDTPPANAEH